MSIRMLALELYRLEREVEEIRREMTVQPDGQRDEWAWKLRMKIWGRDDMRARLQARKQAPDPPRRFFG